MKKCGFTLVELLAVIIILAIISLIAVPIVLNIVEKSKIKSSEEGMFILEKALDLYYYNNQIDKKFNFTTFRCKNGECSNGKELLEVNGKLPDEGIITIDEDGKIKYNGVILNGYICTKDDKFKCQKGTKEQIDSDDSIITINSSKTSLTNYIIYGNSLQDSTPTPSSPQEIKTVGDLVTDSANPNYGKYEIKIKVLGKNLLNMDDFIKTYSNYYKINYETFDGHKVYKFTSASNASSKVKYLEGYFKPKTSYTFTVNGYTILGAGGMTNFVPQLFYKGSGRPYFCNLSKSQWTKCVYTSSDKLSIDYFIISYGRDTATTYIENFQVEVGDTSTEYEPYSEKIYSIYLDEPLRCAGDICDYIDFKEGKLVRQVKEFVFKGNDSYWNDWSSSITEKSMGVLFYNNDILGAYKNPKIKKDKGISNYFKLRNINEFSITKKADSDVGSFAVSANSSPPYIGFKVPFTSLDDWKTFLKEKYENGNPVIVYYALKDSIESEIDLPIIDLNENVSNIIIDTETKPGKVELEYYK